VGYGAAISAGGNIIGGQLQGWASLLDKWSMEDAFNEEIARQARFQKQAAGAVAGQLGGPTGVGSQGAQAQLGQAFQDRTKAYGAVDAVPLSVKDKGMSPRDAARSALMGRQRANLMKYGDWQFGQKMGNLKTGRQLDQITNFAGGESRVFPYRMYDAQHAWDVLAEIGSSISAASSGAAGVKSAFGSGPPGYGGTFSGQQQYGGYGAEGGPIDYSGYMNNPMYFDSQTPLMINPGTGNPNYGQIAIG